MEMIIDGFKAGLTVGAAIVGMAGVIGLALLAGAFFEFLIDKVRK